MTEPVETSAFPVRLTDLNNIINGPVGAHDVIHRGAQLAFALTGVMEAVCQRAEAVARSIDVDVDAGDAIELNAVENRLLGVHDTFASVDIPECLEWTDIGHNVAALTHPALGAGPYYSSYEEARDTTVFAAAIAWKYLAARFAFHQAALGPRPSRYAWKNGYDYFQSTQRAVVSAARTQRKVWGSLDLDGKSLSGQCVALTIQKQSSSADAHLFAISDFGSNSPLTDLLKSKAIDALNAIKKVGVNHAVIFADSFNSSTHGADVELPLTGVHVFGRSNQIRYLCIVSRVSHHTASKHDTDSSISLSKPHLRDAFWRRDSSASRSAKIEETRRSLGVTVSDELPAMQVATNSDGRSLQRIRVVDPMENVVASSGPVLSRSKVAREFFGYRGLKTPNV